MLKKKATESFDRLILLSKIEEGRKHIKNGKTVSTLEAKKKLKKWLS